MRFWFREVHLKLSNVSRYRIFIEMKDSLAV